MNRTRIEWCDRTWNPVTGCLHGCPYCYARNLVWRFGKTYGAPKKINSLDMPIYDEEHYQVQYPFGFAPTFLRYRLEEPQLIKQPQNIFVCSMADLFGEWVPDEWIDKVFDVCNGAPQHRFLFLTKNPKRRKIRRRRHEKQPTEAQ
jgi:protein gp37